jgi:hypothetical protein
MAESKSWAHPSSHFTSILYKSDCHSLVGQFFATNSKIFLCLTTFCWRNSWLISVFCRNICQACYHLEKEKALQTRRKTNCIRWNHEGCAYIGRGLLNAHPRPTQKWPGWVFFCQHRFVWFQLPPTCTSTFVFLFLSSTLIGAFKMSGPLSCRLIALFSLQSLLRFQAAQIIMGTRTAGCRHKWCGVLVGSILENGLDDTDRHIVADSDVANMTYCVHETALLTKKTVV